MKWFLLIIGSIILLLAAFCWVAVVRSDFANPILAFVDPMLTFLSWVHCTGRCVAYVAIGATIVGGVLIGVAST